MVSILCVTTSYGPLLSSCVGVVCVLTIVCMYCCLSGSDPLGARPDGANYCDISPDLLHFSESGNEESVDHNKEDKTNSRRLGSCPGTRLRRSS